MEETVIYNEDENIGLGLAESAQSYFTITPVENNVIEKAMKGDSDSFERLFMGTYRYVFAAVRKNLKNDQDAYDAIQETYTRVYKGISRLENVSSFYPWLHKIAVNCSLDILKQTGQDVMNDLEYDAVTSDKTGESDITADVTEVLKQLEPEQMEIIYHVYYDGMQVTQIARMQGIPKTTVYNRLKSAKKRLKDLLRVRGIEKPIYGGELVSLISTALRNAIGTQLLSMAVAEEILHSVTGSKNEKGAFVLSRFARNMRNNAAKKIAAALLLACLMLFLVGATIFVIFFNLFGNDNGPVSINLGGGIFDWGDIFGSDDDKNTASDYNDGNIVSRPVLNGSENSESSSKTSSPSSSNSSASSAPTSSENTSADNSSSDDTTTQPENSSNSTTTSSQASTPKPPSSPSSSASGSKPSAPSTSSGVKDPVEITYVIRNSGAYITGIKRDLNDEGYLSVPATVEDYGDPHEPIPGYAVVGIDSLNGCENLKQLWLPGTVVEINPYAFDTCKQLEEIAFFTDNPVYSTAGNCLIDKRTKTLIRGFKNSVIPNDGSVTSIGDCAFYGCVGLKRLVIPDSVKNLEGNGTFMGCTDLEYVDAGGLSSIYDMSTFAGCTALKTIILSEKLTYIGGYSFEDCTSLTSITLPRTLEWISVDAFANCKNLKHVYYGGSSSDRSRIEIYSGNTALTSATWHYNS